MRFVQTLHSPDAQEVEPLPEFGTVLTPAIMEDESGTRLLLLAHPGQRVTDRTWDEAVEDGIGYVGLGDGQGWFAALEVEAAIEHAEDLRSPFDFEKAPWIEVSGLDYDSVLDAAGQAQEAAQTPGTFVHLHNHSEYSLLDGFSMVSEMVEVATAQGHTALAVTDHFHVAAHPELANRCKKAGIKPIFGIEANLVDDRHRRGRSWTVMVSEDGRHEYEADSPSDTPPKGYRKEKRSDAKEVLYGYHHITLWAETDQGLRNLWALASVGYTEGFYGLPRVDWEILERYSEGVIATTGCMRGPLAVPLLAGDEAKARENVARLMDIFPDRLYVEIHTNQLEDQIALNWGALALAQDYSLPYFAAVDSHYAKPEHKTPHAVWIAQSTSKGVDEDSDLFAGDQDYHMASEEEARQALAYLGDEVVDAAIATTVQIADRCNAEMVGETEPPIFSKASREHPDPEARDVERLIDLCLDNWDAKVTPAIAKGKYTLEQAVERFEYEMDLIVSKRFSGYFLLVADYVRWAKSEGCLVGPARGSGGASLVAHTADITHLDPIDYDLLFPRFINEGRTELPDFDVDFPKSWRERLKAYLRKRWGEDHTLSIGTITRLRVKGAVDGIMRALKDTEIPLPSWGEIALLKAADDASAQAAAGTKVSWEDFVADHQELMDRLFEGYPEFMTLLEMFVGRVRGFSKHAAGMVVSTSGPLTDLPMRTSDEEDKTLISQFDMDALAALGYVKFDLLTLRTLDTLQQTLDRIEADLGLKIDPYTWDEEYEDPQVWEEVATGHTKGVFQVETKEGTRLTRQYGPRSVLELADVTTLVRPGPRRSGLTNIFLRRKDGLEEVTFPHPLLEETLGTSQGVPIFQEQVMAITMILGGYSSAEADKVRKLLGKKQVELVEEAGREFVSRCKANDVDGDVAERIWEQLAEFAKYCLPADSVISLAGSNGHSDGTITVGELHRRLHSQLPAYANDGKSTGAVGRPKGTFVGPCVLCGNESTTGVYVRGYCQNRCWAWLNKFRTRTKGLHALAWYADDRIRPARILDVVESGVQEVFRVTLVNGKSIRATAGHRHLTQRGYVAVRDLVVGEDTLATDGGYQMPTLEESRQGNRVGVGGHRTWSQWRRDTPKVCAQCGETEGRIEHAHLNGDHQDQRVENYAWLCAGCHKRYDYAVNDRRRRWQKGHLTDWSEVVSIASEGEEPTYDLVMESPHNVVVDGVVTHNSFNKSHAVGYSVVSHWTSWFKVHFPAHYLASLLSTVPSERHGEFVSEARRMGMTIAAPDINLSGVDFTPSGTTLRYGLEAVMSVGRETAEHIVAHQPYSSVEDFRDRAMASGSPVNRGHLKALATVGAFDALFPNRKALDRMLEEEMSGASTTCIFKDPEALGPNGLPCTFDWANEPNPPMETKGRGKNKVETPKPPPKRCTISCRNYTPPEPIDPETITPYTKSEVLEIEREMLGGWVSHDPFDRIPEDAWDDLHTADMVQDGPDNHEYNVVAILEGIRPKVDRQGGKYAFLTMNARDGELEAVCFASVYEPIRASLKTGSMVLATLHKNARGLQVAELLTVPDEH